MQPPFRIGENDDSKTLRSKMIKIVDDIYNKQTRFDRVVDVVTEEIRVSTGAGGTATVFLPSHNHTSTGGGLLDWDDVWTDAAHSHQSDIEGGQLVHDSVFATLNSDSHHEHATVGGAPLTISTQEITFNYDTNDFQLNGNDLQVKDSGIDHGSLSGTDDDDHTGYALLAGRSGGQTLIGGTDSGDDLTLSSTSHATKGSVTITDDIIPSGSGSGLAYGEIYAYENATATTISVQNTWYQLTVFSADGVSNMTTPDHTNDHITIANTGVYKVQVAMTITGTAASKTYQVQVKKNNGATSFTNLSSGIKTSTSLVRRNVTIGGLISLTAADTLELWIKCTDATTANVTCRFLNLSVVQVGG